MGSHRNIYDRMTPSRLTFLKELDRLGVGEPYVRGTTRHHLLKLGWIQGTYEMPDGRKVTDEEFDLERPRDGYQDRWAGVKFGGVTLTDEGRRRLHEQSR